jgi:putative PIG3 family NAD(P)H quinone oxidoreductase
VYAVTIVQPGGPEVLRWTEVPDPVPGRNEVLIDVHASAVNRADLLQRQGLYPPPPGGPPWPGLECSGRIAALGEGVLGWSVGDEVCALLGGGGYAEKAVAPVGQLLPVPHAVSLVDAASLPEVACTVWSNMVNLARLKPGETVLIHGGGSGIGTFAIQLVKALGAKAITTARPAKHGALKELGADHTIDYATEDFVATTKDKTDGRGAEIILDIMGAAYLARNLDALATNGRLAIIGLQGGRTAELDLGAMLGKRASITATSLRTRPLAEKAGIIAGVREQVWPLIEKGAVRPVVDRRLPMAHATEAHRIMEVSEHLGKIVLVTPAAAQPVAA